MDVITEVDFDINCAVCGESLDAYTEDFNTRKMTISLTISPCERCARNAENKGYEAGQKDNNE